MNGLTSVTVSVPLTIRRRPGRRTMVSLPFEDAAGRISTKADPALVKALARAFRYQKLLDEGRYASISDMAAGEKIERGYLGRLLALTLLAPAIIEILIDHDDGAGARLPRFLQPFPTEWSAQSIAFASRE